MFRILMCGLSLMAAVSCGNDAVKADSCCEKKADKAKGECAVKEVKSDDCKEKCNAVVDNMMSRRSIRKYNEQAVDRELLKTCSTVEVVKFLANMLEGLRNGTEP